MKLAGDTYGQWELLRKYEDMDRPSGLNSGAALACVRALLNLFDGMERDDPSEDAAKTERSERMLETMTAIRVLTRELM